MEITPPAEYGDPPDTLLSNVPLAVDLDGTLVRTDLLVESFFVLIRRNPLYAVAALFWLLGGRAYLKRQIGRRVTLDAAALPYHYELLDFLKEQRMQGRRLILASGCDEKLVRQVADYLGIFDGVLATDAGGNLTGRRKRDRLVSEFGERMFDYAGDSRRDLPVWSSARKAVVVHATRSLSRRVARVCEVERVLESRAEWIRTYGRALRVHQWLKNLLVFVPLVLAQRSPNVDLLFRTCVAFVAFSLVASSVYLLNDLIDLPADRHHPHKRERPFATGALSPFWGLLSSPVLCGLGFLTVLLLPLPFAAILAAYFVSNLVYSLWLKQVPVLDVIVLAWFYIARIVGGSAAVAVPLSPWLVAFSTFLFVSLALVKRYGELVTLAIVDGKGTRARGYLDTDKELLASMGAASGFVAVLVLAIFISTGAAEIHYARHQLVWLLCPTLLFWISYVWLTAHRGQMYDDPLVFTLRDRVSRLAIIAAALILLGAR
jgi:4-hydroxybenzoate polyprenyltransferase